MEDKPVWWFCPYCKTAFDIINEDVEMELKFLVTAECPHCGIKFY